MSYVSTMLVTSSFSALCVYITYLAWKCLGNNFVFDCPGKVALLFPFLLYCYLFVNFFFQAIILTTVRHVVATSFDAHRGWPFSNSWTQSVLTNDECIPQYPIRERTHSIARHILCHHFSATWQFFSDDKLVSVFVICLNCLGQWNVPGVVTVTIDAGFFLKAKCFGCTISADGSLNIVLEYGQGAITYCDDLL